MRAIPEPPERVVLLTLHEPTAEIRPPRIAGTVVTAQPRSLAREMRRAAPAPRDSTSIATPNAPTPGPSTALSPQPLPKRLLPERPVVPWYSFPVPRAPLGAARPMTKEERDSALDVMSAMIQDLAAARLPTQGERDSAAKEATLKMRNTGRILLVPPDNSSGLITMPLPLFSRGPSRARRARDNRSFDENRARLERLRLRADSARRARGDSLPR